MSFSTSIFLLLCGLTFTRLKLMCSEWSSVSDTSLILGWGEVILVKVSIASYTTSVCDLPRAERHVE